MNPEKQSPFYETSEYQNRGVACLNHLYSVGGTFHTDLELTRERPLNVPVPRNNQAAEGAKYRARVLEELTTKAPRVVVHMLILLTRDHPEDPDLRALLKVLTQEFKHPELVPGFLRIWASLKDIARKPIKRVWDELMDEELIDLFKVCLKANDLHDKGKKLEHFLAAFLASIDGFVVPRDGINLRTRFQELDVAVEIKGVEHHSSFGTFTICECKNWSSPVSWDELAKLREKLSSRGCKFGIFVALNGVTSGFRNKLGDFLRDGVTIALLTKEDFVKLDVGKTPFEILQETFYATKKYQGERPPQATSRRNPGFSIGDMVRQLRGHWGVSEDASRETHTALSVLHGLAERMLARRKLDRASAVFFEKHLRLIRDGGGDAVVIENEARLLGLPVRDPEEPVIAIDANFGQVETIDQQQARVILLDDNEVRILDDMKVPCDLLPIAYRKEGAGVAWVERRYASGSRGRFEPASTESDDESG